MADQKPTPLRELVLIPIGWPSTLTKGHPPGLYLHRRDAADDGDLVVVTDYGGEAYLTSGEACGSQCYEPPSLVTPVRAVWREVDLG